jgi:hypothetical protein
VNGLVVNVHIIHRERAQPQAGSFKDLHLLFCVLCGSNLNFRKFCPQA